MIIYKSITTGVFLKLVTVRKSGVNTFIECDEKGLPTVLKRAWSVNAKPVEQNYLIREPYEGKITIHTSILDDIFTGISEQVNKDCENIIYKL